MPTTQERLDQAKDARHKLAIGKARVSVGYGDTRVEYTPATLKDLNRYIRGLEAQLSGVKPARNRIRYGVPD
jgi:hypothetical protein